MQRLTVERLGHQGDGIAQGQGGAVFLPLTLPGEEVDATLEGDRGRDIRIVTPSTDRVAAPCRHYRSCGGCAVQHGSDAFVQGWKAGVVARALEAQGLTVPGRVAEAAEPGPDPAAQGQSQCPALPVHTSPPHSRRRAGLSGRRTKSGAMVGFHGRASGTIVEIPGCRLLHPALMELLPLLRELTALGASRSAELDLDLTLTRTGVDLVVSNAKPADPALVQAVTRAAGETFARITWNGETLVQAQPPQVDFGPARVPMPAGAFLQATAEGEAALLAAVLDCLGNPRRVVDLFAGMGTFALPLAAICEVHAVEGAGPMTRALEAGWRSAPGLHRLTTETRDLFRRPLDAAELAGFDAAVIDPPRAGAEAQCCELAASKVARIAYVSCNPVTFARDARILVDAGYSLRKVEVVDQFRWSAHVELAAAFVKS